MKTTRFCAKFSFWHIVVILGMTTLTGKIYAENCKKETAIQSTIEGGELIGSSIELCTVKGESTVIGGDFGFEYPDYIGPNSSFLLINRFGKIFDIGESSVDFSKKDPFGSFSIRHITYDNTLTGLEIGNNIEDLNGNFDFAEGEIDVIDFRVDAATIPGIASFEFIVQDSVRDVVPDIELLLDSYEGDPIWIVTDENGIISYTIDGRLSDNNFDLNPEGVLYIHHARIINEKFSLVSNLETGKNIADVSGCIDITSERVKVVKKRLSGGTLSSSAIQFCAFNTNNDRLSLRDEPNGFNVVSLNNNVGKFSHWIVYNEEEEEIVLSSENLRSLRFATLEEGFYKLKHLSYSAPEVKERIESAENLNSILEISGFLVLDSNEVSIDIIYSNDECIPFLNPGEISTFDPSRPEVEFCTLEGVYTELPKTNFEVFNSSGPKEALLLTDDKGIIIKVGDEGSQQIDLSIMTERQLTSARLYNVVYTDDTTGIEIGNTSRDFKGSFRISESVRVTNSIVNAFPIGNIDLEFIGGDGVNDYIANPRQYTDERDKGRDAWIEVDSEDFGDITLIDVSNQVSLYFQTNFERRDSGVYYFKHITHSGDLQSFIEEPCISTSEGRIKVTVKELSGGKLEAGNLIKLCAQSSISGNSIELVEDNPTRNQIKLTENVGKFGEYLLVNKNDKIVRIANDPAGISPLELPEGDYKLYHVAYSLPKTTFPLTVGSDFSELNETRTIKSSNPINVIVFGAEACLLAGDAAYGDADNDGLSNIEELNNPLDLDVYNPCRFGSSNPFVKDTDGDGIDDKRDFFPSDPSASYDNDCDGKPDEKLKGISNSNPKLVEDQRYSFIVKTSGKGTVSVGIEQQIRDVKKCESNECEYVAYDNSEITILQPKPNEGYVFSGTADGCRFLDTTCKKSLTSEGQEYEVIFNPICNYDKPRSTAFEYINEVKLFFDNYKTGNNNGYNFNATPEIVRTGKEYEFSLTPGYRGTTQYAENWQIYIDLNRDGNFSANEMLFEEKGKKSTVIGELTVPRTAVGGHTLARVVMYWGSRANNDGCGNFAWGEVEDYMTFIYNPNPIRSDFNLVAESSKREVETDQTVINVRELAVYPNPSQGRFNLTFQSATEESLSVEILDISGKVVHTETIDYSVGEINKFISASNLSTGVYFLNINNKVLSSDPIKIIIE